MNTKGGNAGTDKIERVLALYTKLMSGSVIHKDEEAVNYDVNERSIQRDIDDIRDFLDKQGVENGIINTIVFDRIQKGYRIEHVYQNKFTNPEILAICKILLDSRAFTKQEMVSMLDKMVNACVPELNQKIVKELIRNEEFHYIEPRHKSIFIDKMWDIGNAIHESRFIEIKYRGVQGSNIKTRKLKPVAIMFSEMYFYMAAYIDDPVVRENFSVENDSYPTIYRIDRIQDYQILEDRFSIPYASRFEEGEFRKRVQFMYGGRLRKVRFKCQKHSVEAILDRLPTAIIEHEESESYIISAEVFGDGIDMWIRSQGDKISLID